LNIAMQSRTSHQSHQPARSHVLAPGVDRAAGSSLGDARWPAREEPSHLHIRYLDKSTPLGSAYFFISTLQLAIQDRISSLALLSAAGLNVILALVSRSFASLQFFRHLSFRCLPCTTALRTVAAQMGVAASTPCRNKLLPLVRFLEPSLLFEIARA
jgi:hypothetical protein